MLESFDQFAMSFGFPIWLFGVLFGFVSWFCGTILKSFEKRHGVILVRWWSHFANVLAVDVFVRGISDRVG